ncbi:DUF3667 domain-containing protein [Pseudoduganella flava]|uniref:DUF3667 domain-containing protein n=1 Tax=Pseudoduganella flava TaxID=871742 RepID=A0ABX6G176_9BURK|nr:DUF3667 domain-containing protein [Pseudoduganella flava]
MRHTADAHDDAPAHCRNCGTATAGNYCSHCGQETRLHMPSFMEFAHEFVGHYVALEGRLWGTFARLLFRPGALTNEYLAGRRRRYVEPLRLYLTLSILFFALIRFSGMSIVDFGKPAAERPAATAPAAEGSEHHTDLPTLVESGAPGLRHVVDRFDKLSAEQKGKAISDSFFHYAPYAMFCLMPLFALYLKGLYLGTGRRYGEHLLFALHANAFAFVLLAAFVLVPDGFFKFVLFCWLLGYLPWAMQRVYRKGKWGTAWRWFLLIVLHMLSLLAAVIVAMFLGVALAH